jgi:hypothetical protein
LKCRISLRQEQATSANRNGRGDVVTNFIVLGPLLVGQDLADWSLERKMDSRRCEVPVGVPAVERKHRTRVESQQSLWYNRFDMRDYLSEIHVAAQHIPIRIVLNQYIIL